MINVNSIGYALFTTLSSDSAVVHSGYTVRFNEEINTDESLLPWIGVVFNGMTLEPHTIGKPTWLADVKFDVFIQDGSYDGAEEAGFKVLTSQFSILSAINSAFTLGGAVHNLVGVDVSLLARDLEEESLILTHRVNLTYQVRG